MDKVKSKDGTPIAFDKQGDGPAVIFVDGAMSTRSGKQDLAKLPAVPTLVMSGSNGAPFMLETAKTLSEVIPHARLSILDGQAHAVHAEALAPVLVEFFAS